LHLHRSVLDFGFTGTATDSIGFVSASLAYRAANTVDHVTELGLDFGDDS
jgi:hypothetical protein